MGNECTYCGSNIERHDPVFVNVGANTSTNQAGQFCNYACLATHIEEEGLTDGAACEWPC
ncbi:hypothetical protein SAMN05444342_3522 [Haladaptatus paucihalophilus DX253]|uniref:MYM-type domain-containing protein n=1 Tax=Haladaptatus paucihalophilus DX253 TaxID=797209 RepID=A0A1M6ZPG2_HALPU|nr:hypothetical protein HAL_33540 [Haladaptatus sp. T7]SHL32320.1 hypothetical protein SAMN05444342_3522 [Haladaptatus paucihalophilus DX253]